MGNAAQRATAWAAADVFCSLVDNVQETFGLTPIEAMAAGLPVVASDWNGYRDTVRDGIDGFLVPTLMLQAPLGADLAARYELGADNYDVYCGYASQLVPVDAAAAEVRRLFADAGLRHRMGESSRQRAETLYDWRIVIASYQALWADLAERRRSDPNLADRPTPAANPARLDPFAAFASYPTATLDDDQVARLAPGADAAMLAERRALAMVAFAAAILPHIQAMLDLLAEGPRRVGELLATLPPARRSGMARGLVWLGKLDMIRLSSPH
jgi:starch synthase